MLMLLLSLVTISDLMNYVIDGVFHQTCFRLKGQRDKCFASMSRNHKSKTTERNSSICVNDAILSGMYKQQKFDDIDNESLASQCMRNAHISSTRQLANSSTE